MQKIISLTKNIVFLLTLLIATNSFSQSEFQAEVDLGYAFQGDLMFNDDRLSDSNAFGVRFGLNYLHPIKNNFFFETGLYGKYNTSSREIETVEFSTNSLKLQLPLYAGYRINETWRANIGVSVENNKDFEDFFFRTENNLRYDLLTKLVYSYTEKIDFSFYTNWILSSIPDEFAISSPRNGVYLGVIYQLKKAAKNKKEEL